LIFPKQEPMTALILTYAIIPLSMVARPIGSLVFGYIGDAYGRGSALFWSFFINQIPKSLCQYRCRRGFSSKNN
jgi:MFS family permease